MAKYKAYPEYKDSGVEWIGNIPPHWEVASLSKLFSIKAGGDVQQSLFSEVCSDDYPYPIYTNANDEFAVYGYTKKANYQSNTITVSGRGDVGFAVYRNHAYDAIIRLLVLAPLKRLECKFYSYFINSVIDFKVESSAIGQLSTQQISPYKSVIPSRVEQRNITIFLDHETAKIDNLIEKQQQLIELLKEKRQAVISHAVTKGLNPDVPMKDSGVEWLGEVPQNWNVVKGGYIGRLFGSESVSESSVSDFGQLPFIKVSTLSLDSFVLNQPEWFIKTPQDKNYKPESNYIVFPKRGAAIFTNKVNLVRESSIIDPNLMGWKIKEGISDEYVAFVLKKRGLSDIADVSTVPQINNKHIAPEKFPLPPYEEQLDIVFHLQKSFSTIDDLIAITQKGIELSQERRTALISAAVTGKIDVRDWVAPDTQDIEEPEEATA